MGIERKYISLILILGLFNFPCFSKASIITLPKKKENFTQKNEFLGSWNMQTIVTNSNCPYIFVGSTTESNLEIKPALNTKNTNSKHQILKGLWKGGNWTQSSSTIKLLNEKEAITERITEFKTKDENYWKAVLIDHLQLDENNSMHSESIVIQYKNGLPVGEYKTYSILTKSETTN